MLEEVTELLKRGEFQRARLLAEKMDRAIERHNLLGIISYHEGKIDEAEEHFKKALDLDPTHDDTLFNYAKVLFEKGEYFESWRYLTRIKQKTWEVYDMLGDTQLKQGNHVMAVHYYRKAAELSNFDQMWRKYSQAREIFRKTDKLAILCLPGLENFIRDIASVLSNVYDVKLVVTTDGKQIVEAYNWADIVWLEWANEMAVEVTNKLIKGNKRVICRLHGYESLRKDFLNSINWDFIDTMIFVADNVRETAFKNAPKLKEIPYQMVYNGIDLTKYEFKKRNKGTRLVFVGHFNYKKNPIMAIQILKKLCDLDRNYKLFWAGLMQDDRIFNYVSYITEKMGIKSNFQFDGFQNDVNRYLEDKDIFLSTSIHEGYGVAILEAMAKGIKPVVHNFYIAEEFYPPEYIFNTIDEAVQMVTSDDYDSEKYRRFVEENCSLEKQMGSIMEILGSETKKNFKNTLVNTSFEVLQIGDNTLKVVDPSKTDMIVRTQNYEEDLEYSLDRMKAPINFIDPRALISDKNIEYMLDFLEEFIKKGVHYRKTLYYAFLRDMYEKGFYKRTPEQIIDSFLKLYHSLKNDKAVHKPVVAFINDGNLKGLSFHGGSKSHVDIPKDVPLWLISGRHRVAIAAFLGFEVVPAYVVRNRFKNMEKLGFFSVLPTFWRYYIQENEEKYKEFIRKEYAGAFGSEYQLFIDPAKKKIVTDFVLSVKPKKVIDIGCNRGELSYEFLKLGIDVVGIDISPREALELPRDYPFVQMNIAEEELPMNADVILFLSVYHHIVYNYGLGRADQVFFKLLSKTKYLVFDSGHPQERGVYRQSWVRELQKHFSTEKELLDHFSVQYQVLGKWRTSQGDERTIVVFTNPQFS